jgi:hypothetical protein
MAIKAAKKVKAITFAVSFTVMLLISFIDIMIKTKIHAIIKAPGKSTKNFSFAVTT